VEAVKMGAEKEDVRTLRPEERLFFLRPDGKGWSNTVLSRSSDRKYHVVLWTSDAHGFKSGDVSCDCPSAVFGKGKPCWHQQRVAALAVGTILKGIMRQREEALSAEPQQVRLDSVEGSMPLEAVKDLGQA
jgi:hypothetical protein